MTKSKTFWAAAAVVCLAVMSYAGYAIYERVSLHFSGDTIEVHPVPLPVAQEDEEETTPAAKEETAAVEKAGDPAQTPAAEKPHAIKTLFEYKDAKAKSVSIAGSFTSWKNVKMAKKNGVWKAEIYILPGTYPYHFTVDGNKRLAPGKPKTPTGDSLVDVN